MKWLSIFQAPRASASPGVERDHGHSRTVLWFTALSLLIFVVWAYFAELDQVSRAPGVVIASSRTQVIQSQDGGVLNELLVREGDEVEPDQLLARLEQTRVHAAYLETESKAAALFSTKDRLHAEVFGTPYRPAANPFGSYPEFGRNQLELYRKRQSALQQELAALQDMKRLVMLELSMNQPLVATGDVSRTEVLRLQRQVADLQAQITNRQNKFFQDAQAELNKVQEELAGVEQNLTQRRNLLQQTELRSPLKGIVKNVRITTQGGVIRPGEEVMQIVPLEDDLLIEARISPADIAFLSIGQTASVKIDAYDYTVYGDLKGALVYISADTLSENLQQGEHPYYRVRVKTDGRQFSGRPGAQLDILPGMTATVEIKTARRSVLHYLTKPITKTLSESMGER